jgi:hypothetical protein
VFLSHQQTIGTTPTACIRFTVLSRIEILHILLEHPYDSQRNKNAGLSSPTSSATASREKPGSVQSAPTFQRRLPSSDRLHTSSRRIRAASRGCGDRDKVHPAGRAGSRIPGALLAPAAKGRCGSGVATALPVGSPPTSHTDIVVPVAFRQGVRPRPDERDKSPGCA